MEQLCLQLLPAAGGSRAELPGQGSPKARASTTFSHEIAGGFKGDKSISILMAPEAAGSTGRLLLTLG